LSTFAKWAAGFAREREIPPLANPAFRQWFERRAQHSTSGAPRVLLWADTFNTYFTPRPLMAAVEVLERAGWSVEIPSRPICCGRPLYTFGFLDIADRMWTRTLTELRPYIEQDVPIIGLEPACVSAFHDELKQMRPHDP